MNQFRHALVSGTGALCFVVSTLSIAALGSSLSADAPLSTHALDSSPMKTSQGVTAWLDTRLPITVNIRSMSSSFVSNASAPRKANQVGASQSRFNPATAATTLLWQNQVDDSLSVDVLKEEHRLTSTPSRFVKQDSNSNRAARTENSKNALTVPPKQDVSRANASRRPADEGDASFVALVPENLIPIYKAAGSRFNIPWTVLAAIHKTETDFGTGDCPVSSAGAEGPMQFEPSTFEAYAVKAPGHAGPPNIQNVDDAIYTAANMLAKKGFSNSPSQAIFAYNHSNWYVKRITTLAGIS